MGSNCPVGGGNKVLTMVFRQRVISFHLHETSFTVSVPLQKLICSEPVFPMNFRGQEGCQILCQQDSRNDGAWGVYQHRSGIMDIFIDFNLSME